MKAIKTAQQYHHPLASVAPGYPVIAREIQDESELRPGEQAVTDGEYQALLDQYKDVIEQWKASRPPPKAIRPLQAEVILRRGQDEEGNIIERIESAKVNHDLETDGSFRSLDPEGGFVAWDPSQNREVMIKIVDGVLTVLPASGSPRYPKEKIEKIRKAKAKRLEVLKSEKPEDLVDRIKALESQPKLSDLVAEVRKLAERVAALEDAITIRNDEGASEGNSDGVINAGDSISGLRNTKKHQKANRDRSKSSSS